MSKVLSMKLAHFKTGAFVCATRRKNNKNKIDVISKTKQGTKIKRQK